MMFIFLGRQLWRPESLGTFVDDSLELPTARAMSNKCEFGMARKRLSACLWSTWQQKPGEIHRYAEDTIQKKLFLPVLLRICVFVYFLKKSQPNLILVLWPNMGKLDKTFHFFEFFYP